MQNISKHNSKEKGKSNYSENSRIDFPVPWNSISIHNLLENLKINFICIIELG